MRDVCGSFSGTSARDGVERYYAFTQVGDLPLVLNVALAIVDIEAGWRAKAAVISAVVLALCGLAACLSLLFGCELRRRAEMQAELARVSLTDASTGLPNRRRFEGTFEHAWKSARRTGKPLSLLVVDADHFKRYYDLHGHAVGDAVLNGLARCLSASVHRPDDLVARVGGEEFVLPLPNTDEAGAMRVAEKVHAAVASLSVEAARIDPGTVTIALVSRRRGVGHGSAPGRSTRPRTRRSTKRRPWAGTGPASPVGLQAIPPRRGGLTPGAKPNNPAIACEDRADGEWTAQAFAAALVPDTPFHAH